MAEVLPGGQRVGVAFVGADAQSGGRALGQAGGQIETAQFVGVFGGTGGADGAGHEGEKEGTTGEERVAAWDEELGGRGEKGEHQSTSAAVDLVSLNAAFDIAQAMGERMPLRQSGVWAELQMATSGLQRGVSRGEVSRSRDVVGCSTWPSMAEDLEGDGPWQRGSRSG